MVHLEGIVSHSLERIFLEGMISFQKDFGRTFFSEGLFSVGNENCLSRRDLFAVSPFLPRRYCYSEGPFLF